MLENQAGPTPESIYHISYYIKEHLHWLPISTRIEYKVLLLVLKAQMGWHLNISVTPSDFCHIPSSSTLPGKAGALCPWTMAMSRSLSVIGPSLWDRLPPSARAALLSSNLFTSLSFLKTCLFSWS